MPPNPPTLVCLRKITHSCNPPSKIPGYGPGLPNSSLLTRLGARSHTTVPPHNRYGLPFRVQSSTEHLSSSSVAATARRWTLGFAVSPQKTLGKSLSCPYGEGKVLSAGQYFLALPLSAELNGIELTPAVARGQSTPSTLKYNVFQSGRSNFFLQKN